MIKPWSSILLDWWSETTFPNRNLWQHSMCQKLFPLAEKILILWWSWPEAMEVSHLNKNSLITNVDRSSSIDKFIEKIKEWVDNIIDLFNVFNDHAKLPEHFFHWADIEIYKTNHPNLQIINADVSDFLSWSDDKYEVIMAHSILNNTRAQEWKDVENIFWKMLEKLSNWWIISLADNYEWFQNDFKWKNSTIDLCKKHNLEILYHWPYYLWGLWEWDKKFLWESNNLLLWRKKDNIVPPIDKEQTREYIKNILKERWEQYTEWLWTYSDFNNSLVNGNVNLLMIKTWINQFYWVNLHGEYPEVFEWLFQGGNHFQPKHISDFIENNEEN